MLNRPERSVRSEPAAERSPSRFARMEGVEQIPPIEFET
jgi:hypothetical protein